MSKPEIVNDVNEKEESVETTETVEVNEIKMDEPIYWESLLNIREDLVKNIIQQQATILELVKRYEKELETDTETAKAIDGISLSIQDLAKNVAEITNKHKNADGSFKKGLIDNDDDMLEYLNYASTYVAIDENLANLLATAYIDVISRLTTDTILKAQIKETKEELLGENKDGDK